MTTPSAYPRLTRMIPRCSTSLSTLPRVAAITSGTKSTGCVQVERRAVCGRLFLRLRFRASTLTDDGDPIDVLVLMEEPAFVGCLVPSGSSAAFMLSRPSQASPSVTTACRRCQFRNHRDVRTLDDLNQNLVHEIEHFFVSYNTAKGKTFEPQDRFGRTLPVCWYKAAERFRSR